MRDEPVSPPSRTGSRAGAERNLATAATFLPRGAAFRSHPGVPVRARTGAADRRSRLRRPSRGRGILVRVPRVLRRIADALGGPVDRLPAPPRRDAGTTAPPLRSGRPDSRLERPADPG